MNECAQENAAVNDQSSFCHYCGSQQITVEGCHLRCHNCGQVSEGCGD